MKKTVALITASLMFAMPMFALADASDSSPAPVSDYADALTSLEPCATTPAGISIFDRTPEESLEVSAALNFEDDNFALNVPDAWTVAEQDGTPTYEGLIALLTDESGAQALSVRRVAANVASLDELLTLISGIEDYTDAHIVLLGSVAYVAYDDTTAGTHGYCAPNAAGDGYMVFEFAAGEDAEYTARQVLASLAPIDATQDMTILAYSIQTGEGTDGSYEPEVPENSAEEKAIAEASDSDSEDEGSET
ncbi:MAG: hypothetical protein ACI4L8_09675 [Candidatus Fimadaptatus sp.]